MRSKQLLHHQPFVTQKQHFASTWVQREPTCITSSIGIMERHTAKGAQKDVDPVNVVHTAETKKEFRCNLQSPFEIIFKYRSQLKRLRTSEPHELCQKKITGLSSELGNTSGCQVLTAVSILRMARAKQLQYNSSMRSDLFTQCLEYDACLSHENEIHFKRALALFNAAESFSRQEYSETRKFLMPLVSAMHADHPVERVITCFARDLHDMTGEASHKIDLERKVIHSDIYDIKGALMHMRIDVHSCEQKLPFSQITQYTGIQTIMDHVGSAERIHFIDIGTKFGSQWIVLMHALATREACKLKQLKITAICADEDKCEETGKLLSSFAESMNLNFIFKRASFENKKLRRDHLALEDGEVVAVYMEYCLLCMSSNPEYLEALLGEIKNLNPCVVVVVEIEADTKGSSTFIGRFDESLFLCSALFDCLEACLERHNRYRKANEQIFFHEIVKKKLMDPKEETLNYSLTIDSWRLYLGRFGLVETDLSPLSMCQASLFIREYANWKCCTLDMNKKSMLIGWNGTPLRSVSAWKFQHTK